MRIIDADKVLLSIMKMQQEYEGMSRLVEDKDPYFLGAIIGLKETAFEMLRAIEVDAEPVRHGRWDGMVDSKLDDHTGEYWEEVYYNCLECDYASDWKSPYCPNCGAKMDLEVDDG